MSPTYEFLCGSCKAVTEKFFTVKSKPDTVKCASCGKDAESIVSGGSAFHLKGHGWGFDRYAGPSNFSNLGKDDE